MGQVRGMGASGRPGASGGRVGLVLGAGGVVGAAWMTGALQAVQDRLPMAINDVNLILGTSAGSVLAAALRCGVSLDEMVALQRGDGSAGCARRGWVTWTRGHCRRGPSGGPGRPG